MVIAYIVYVANGVRRRKKKKDEVAQEQNLHDVYSVTDSEIDEETEYPLSPHKSERPMLPGSEEHKFKVFYNELEKQDSLSANILCYISYRVAHEPGMGSF